MTTAKIIVGDVRQGLATLPEKCVQTVVTSPPYYGLRDYGAQGQIGLEETPQQFVAAMVEVFDAVWRVLADDGVLWLNLGDSYANSGGVSQPHRDNNAGFYRAPGTRQQPYAQAGGGFVRPSSLGGVVKAKELLGIPWRVAFALQEAGWYLRQDIIWAKPNPMPESVTDRCTKSHEYIFMLTKQGRYYFDNEAIKEPAVSDIAHAYIRFGGNKYGDSDDPKHATKSGNIYEQSGTRNKRDVWNVATQPFKGAHFAVMPEAIVEPCVRAASRPGDLVLDPFTGSGTVGVVALREDRRFVGCELNPEYALIAKERIGPLLTEIG